MTADGVLGGAAPDDSETRTGGDKKKKMPISYSLYWKRISIERSGAIWKVSFKN